MPVDVQTVEQRRVRALLAAGLVAAGQRAAAARASRGAAIAEVGAFLRRDRDAGMLLGRAVAGQLAGLSRPTLDRAAAEVDRWLVVVGCARRALAGDGQAVAELHACRPDLAGWWGAAEHIRAAGVGDRAADAVVAEYLSQVRLIARG